MFRRYMKQPFLVCGQCSTRDYLGQRNVRKSRIPAYRGVPLRRHQGYDTIRPNVALLRAVQAVEKTSLPPTQARRDMPFTMLRSRLVSGVSGDEI